MSNGPQAKEESVEVNGDIAGKESVDLVADDDVAVKKTKEEDSADEEDGTEEEGEDDDDDDGDDEQQTINEVLIKQAEERAIADATLSANASYVPSNSLMSNPSPTPLIESVDGISLSEYNQLPSLFTANSVPVALRATLEVPIIITNGGSIVEYIVESESYDINFGIKAERDDETTVVHELNRVDSHLQAVTGKFLVGTVPCALIFTFSNDYSWFREKKVTYSITVTPPSIENISAGRKKRAESALNVVLKDKADCDTRLERATAKRGGLAEEVERLEKELEEKRKSLDVVEKEESWLIARVQVRAEQQELLEKRLNQGWDDEKEVEELNIETGNEV